MSLIVLFFAIGLLDGTWLRRLFSVSGVSEILSFVIAISVLIFIHELGHFLTAKGLGVGVERFSLGFGPRLWGFRRGETDYRISAVPLGGYVKMVGEDPKEGEALSEAERARSFTHKPLWARFLIVFAGPGMNFVLAIGVTALIFMTYGRPVVPSVIGRVVEGSGAAAAGLKPGDRIVAVDGQPVQYWDEFERLVEKRRGETLRLTVRSVDGERNVAVTPQRRTVRDILGDDQTLWDLGVRHSAADAARIVEVAPGGPADRAGLRPGDVVVTLDGQPVLSFEELATRIRSRAGQPTELGVRRGEGMLTVTVTPDPKTGLIGISHVSEPIANVTFVRSNPAVALWEGVVKTGDFTFVTVRALLKLVRGELSPSNIGSPIQIAVVSGQQARQGLVPYATFVAVISINLAVLNLLPIPVLDGGHILFFALEAVLRRPVGLRTREVAHQVGFFLLLLLMVFAVYNDIARYLPLFR